MRNALLVVHPTRPEALAFAKELIPALSASGISSLSNISGGIDGA